METWTLGGVVPAVFLYLELTLLGCSIGLWFSCSRRSAAVLGLPALARFLTGFAITPLALGLYMMGLSLLPGGSNKALAIGPVWLFIAATAWRFRAPLAPRLRSAWTWVKDHLVWVGLTTAAVAAGICLGLNLRYPRYGMPAAAIWILIACALALNWRPLRPPRRSRSWADWALAAVALVGVVELSQMLTTQIYRSHVDVVDGLQYLGEAQYFLNHFGPDGWASLAESADSSVVGTTHNFAWSAYLAFSLEHTPGHIGLGHDAAANAAFGFSAVCVVAALVAVGAALRNWRAAAIGVSTLLVLPAFTYILRAFSRDGFRITGLLVCLLTVWGASEAAATEHRLRTGHLALGALGGFYALAAHPMNALAGVGLAGGLVAWALARGGAGWRFWAISAATGVGAAGGMAGPLLNALRGGSLEGDYVSTETILSGTPYEANYQASRDAPFGDLPTLWDRVWHLLTSQPGGLILWGVLAAVTAVILVGRRSVSRRLRATALLTATPLIVTLATVGDWISWYGHPLSRWYAINIRYTFHPTVFAILAIMGLVALVPALVAARSSRASVAARPTAQREGDTRPRQRGIVRLRAVSRAALGWGTVAVTVLVFGLGQPYESDATSVRWIRRPGAIDTGTPGVLLMDNIHAAYLAEGPALSLFAPEARDILTARDVDELETALDAHGVTGILSWSAYYKDYWVGEPLREYLDAPENFSAPMEPFPSETLVRYRIYQRL